MKKINLTLKLQLQSLHWLFGFIEISPLLPPVLCFQNILTKTCVLKSSLLIHRRSNILLVNLWQLITVSNVCVCTPAWQAMWTAFKFPGFVCKPFLPFFPNPYPLFDSCSLFFDPKPHRNACNTGYENYTLFNINCSHSPIFSQDQQERALTVVTAILVLYSVCPEGVVRQ